MVEFRDFNPETDSLDELARMNEWTKEQQEAFAVALKQRFLVPANAFVAVDNGHIVGAVIIHDGGFPFALIDGVYLKQEYRHGRIAKQFEQALDNRLIERGVSLFFFHPPEWLAQALLRKGNSGYVEMSQERFVLMGHVPQLTEE